jgi:hypothetical protein
VAATVVVTSGAGLGLALHPSAGSPTVAASDDAVGPVASPTNDAKTGVTARDDRAVTAQERPDPPMTIRVNLTGDGDARWTVVTRVALEDETDRAAFRDYVEDLRAGASPRPRVGYSPETFRQFVDDVETDTGRAEMRIVDPEWNGTVRGDTGELWLSFTWTNFARTDGDRVLLGDVFRTDLGWFASLSSDQRLVIAPPPGYAVTESPFPIEGAGTIRIDGADDVPDDVTAENASVVYEPTASTTSDPPPGGLSVELLGGGVAVVILVALVAAYLVGRGSERDAGGSPGAAADPGTDAGAGAETSDGGDAAGPTAGDEGGPSPTSDGEPAATGEGTGGATAAGTDVQAGDGTATGDAAVDVADDGAASPVDEELLSDEERVERLLADNGGRMKQAQIVSETGWSNAKVSQLLSSMDDDDRVDKLRIGRENLISLPEESVVGTSDSSRDGDPTSTSDSGEE